MEHEKYFQEAEEIFFRDKGRSKEQGTAQTPPRGLNSVELTGKPALILVHITLSSSKDSGKPEQINRFARAFAYPIHKV